MKYIKKFRLNESSGFDLSTYLSFFDSFEESGEISDYQKNEIITLTQLMNISGIPINELVKAVIDKTKNHLAKLKIYDFFNNEFGDEINGDVLINSNNLNEIKKYVNAIIFESLNPKLKSPYTFNKVFSFEKEEGTDYPIIDDFLQYSTECPDEFILANFNFIFNKKILSKYFNNTIVKEIKFSINNILLIFEIEDAKNNAGAEFGWIYNLSEDHYLYNSEKTTRGYYYDILRKQLTNYQYYGDDGLKKMQNQFKNNRSNVMVSIVFTDGTEESYLLDSNNINNPILSQFNGIWEFTFIDDHFVDYIDEIEWG